MYDFCCIESCPTDESTQEISLQLSVGKIVPGHSDQSAIKLKKLEGFAHKTKTIIEILKKLAYLLVRKAQIAAVLRWRSYLF